MLRTASPAWLPVQRAVCTSLGSTSRPAPYLDTAHATSITALQRWLSYTRCLKKKSVVANNDKEKRALREAYKKERGAQAKVGRLQRIEEDVSETPAKRAAGMTGNAAKKMNKQKPGQPADSVDPTLPDPHRAFDLKDVNASYVQIDDRFEQRLQRLQNAGASSAQVIGRLMIVLDKNDCTKNCKLNDIAQVTHRGGRMISILVSDPTYIKSIKSAVLSSPDFNQQPQQDPENELELVMKLDPELPEELQRKVKEQFTNWRNDIRKVRDSRLKLHSDWKQRMLLVDEDVRSLEKKVKELQDKEMKRIDQRERDVLKALASRQQKL